MQTRPTLLLVEDDLNDAALFRLAFEKLYPDVQLQTVQEVTSAMHHLHGTGGFKDREVFPFPYAVVVDLTLPVISGASLVQWIRAQPEFGKLLIAAWTGSREGRDIAQLYRLGVNSFLTKAPSTEELIADLQDMHAFWHQLGLLVDFKPQHDFSTKPARPRKHEFFFRNKDWPGFEPPSVGK
jgi:two-component system, response regulator